MNLEHYAISAICNYDDAATFAITKMKAKHFTAQNQGLYKIATGLFKRKKSVDLGVFCSQASTLGFDEATASMIYHYALDYSDMWQNNLEELIKVGTYRVISEHVQEIDNLRASNEPIQKISAQASKFASEWVTGVEKTYYSGKEVDELREETGEPIKTGYPILDDEVYKWGGNRKGQMKGVLLREKHGKTRSECWESAQNIRMGHKVLYIALEATKKEIVGNFKQVLQSDWPRCRENLFVVDGVRDLSELESIILEAVLVESVEKVVVDYVQLVQVEKAGSENVRINEATETFRHLMIRHNFHCVLLSQARKESTDASVPKDAEGNPSMPKGYRFVPNVYDAYGSNALVKASSIIMIGLRPKNYDELAVKSPMGIRILAPNGLQESYHSLFMKVALSRYRSDNLHRWLQFTDSDEGLKLGGWL